MGITQEEADKLQQRVTDARKQDAAGGLTLATDGIASLLGPPVQARGTTVPRDIGMNKLEARYAQHLEQEKRVGRILAYRFEAVKLRLADNTSLTPDFLVVDCDGFVEFHDCKGYFKSKNAPHVEDDAAVKLKVAAQQYPYFKFCIVWQNITWHRRDY